MAHTDTDTIVALSSGALPCGVAVLRVSGSRSRDILIGTIGSLPNPRNATLAKIFNHTSELIDEGLVLWFPGPASYTGEDCVEFHVHGGKAVVASLLSCLCEFSNTRLADAGEFSRRSFINGKNDLTAIDGIADLIASETEAQRRLATQHSQGLLRELYDGWRERLIFVRAMLEAEFDFSDEEDVPEEISKEGMDLLKILLAEISDHLDDNNAGEIIRDGFKVALMGKPNAGKSSLINALARRDIAIVTEKAGTTRDVLEVNLDIGGNKVVIFDTAGLRVTDDVVEKEGVRRANAAADSSDLCIWLYEDPSDDFVGYTGDTEVLRVQSKCDVEDGGGFSISSQTGVGLEELTSELLRRVTDRVGNEDAILISRQRYRNGLEAALSHLTAAVSADMVGLEMRAEEVRLAGVELGRLTGKVDVEDLLDVIFSEFCVGK